MVKELDRDMISDGDVIGVEISTDVVGNKTVWLTLSHKANEIQICLTKKELDWLSGNLI